MGVQSRYVALVGGRYERVLTRVRLRMDSYGLFESEASRTSPVRPGHFCDLASRSASRFLRLFPLRYLHLFYRLTGARACNFVGQVQLPREVQAAPLRGVGGTGLQHQLWPPEFPRRPGRCYEKHVLRSLSHML